MQPEITTVRGRRRRPQWRGERRAVLVRLPDGVAAELEDRARALVQSLSDAAGEQICGEPAAGGRWAPR